jgi:hypothetical protein
VLAHPNALEATGAISGLANDSVTMPEEINFSYDLLVALFDALPACAAGLCVEPYEISGRPGEVCRGKSHCRTLRKWLFAIKVDDGVRQRLLTIVKKSRSDSLANPAEGDGGDAEIRGDVLLGNPLNDAGIGFQQVQVSLSRVRSDVCSEECGIAGETPEGHFKKEILELGEVLKQHLEPLLVEYQKSGGLDAFDPGGAGLVGAESYY